MVDTAKKRPTKKVSAKPLPQTHVQPLVERTAAGKALRERCPRKQQGQSQPPADRADPVDLLIENSRGRMEYLIPIRYGRMLANPFAFYRGAAAIMAYLCGRALARAHVRSGDAAVLTGYMGQSSTFEEALADFSVAYADQNERDHAALVAAVRDRRIETQMEA